MIDQLLQLITQINETPQLVEQIAKMYHMFYRSLVNAGFTNDEALQIVINQGPGITQK